MKMPLMAYGTPNTQACNDPGLPHCLVLCELHTVLPISSRWAALIHPGEDSGRLLHLQVVLYGFDPFHASCDFPCFFDGLLRINGAAQLNSSFVCFNTDLE